MNKFFYFSRSRLKLVEVLHYRLKMALFIIFTIIAGGATAYFGFELANPAAESPDLHTTNVLLKKNIMMYAEQYKKLERSIDSLIAQNNDLRLAANLDVQSNDILELGIGGGEEMHMSLLGVENKQELSAAISYIELVKRKTLYIDKNLRTVEERLERNKKFYSHIPAILPAVGIFSDRFGMRRHPILRYYRFHSGLDIKGNRGAPIYATGDGTVSYSGWSGGFGLSIEIDHGYGYKTRYAHLSKANVKVGQKVERGEVIGGMGNSGLSTGTHLHYEVTRYGVKLDPEEFFYSELSW